MAEKAGNMQAELGRLRRSEEMLCEALLVLYDLLELYGPIWYDEGHHDQAEAALRICGPCLLPD